MAADGDEPEYQIEFYQEDDGREPALAFMQSLSRVKRAAIGVALNEVLEYLGPNVVGTDYGKNLGEGLFEFRLDQDAEEILKKKGKSARPEPDAKILLRVFFHPHGKKLLLLLSGYDKAEHDKKSFQNARIEEARKLLTRWKERQKTPRK